MLHKFGQMNNLLSSLQWNFVICDVKNKQYIKDFTRNSKLSKITMS